MISIKLLNYSADVIEYSSEIFSQTVLTGVPDELKVSIIYLQVSE